MIYWTDYLLIAMACALSAFVGYEIMMWNPAIGIAFFPVVLLYGLALGRASKGREIRHQKETSAAKYERPEC